MNKLVGVAFVSAFMVLAAIILLVNSLTFVDNYEFAYKFDAITGEVEVLKDNETTFTRGYVLTKPFVVMVHTVDLKPFQICLSPNTRVLNCKLIEFNPEGIEQFIAWHGRGDYSTSDLKFKNIMMTYAYDIAKRPYPFLTIKDDTNMSSAKSPDNTSVSASSADTPADTSVVTQ